MVEHFEYVCRYLGAILGSYKVIKQAPVDLEKETEVLPHSRG